METTPFPAARHYDVTANFCSGDDCFAVEAFTIDIAVGIDPYPVASARAELSPYANERVPDLVIALVVTQSPGDDPGPAAPPGAGEEGGIAEPGSGSPDQA